MYPPVPSGTSVYHTPHSSYSTSQSGASNFQYPGYPPYPIPATSQPVNYPQFPASTPVSSPYPTQPSYPPYPSSQPNLVSSVSSTVNFILKIRSYIYKHIITTFLKIKD